VELILKKTIMAEQRVNLLTAHYLGVFSRACKPFKAIAEGGGRAAKRLAFYFDHVVLAGVVVRVG